MDTCDRLIIVFFFKQKTAYEMCGRDWSSDVCSSDLALADALAANTTLKHVNISWNRLTYPVAAKLAKSLLVNESLETLKVRKSALRQQGSIECMSHSLLSLA